MNEEPLQRAYRALRDWVYDNYHWAYVIGTGLICQALMFPSKKWALLSWLASLLLGALLEPCVNPYRQIYGRSLWRGSREHGSVALTFDDGPDESTAELLDLLRAEGVKATFFCIGEQMARHPELVRRIHAEGHLLGNHTYSHPNLLTLSPQATEEQLRRTQSLFAELIPGFVPQFWRPPFGYRAPWTYSVAQKLGLQAALWSINPRDFQDPGVEVIVSRTMELLQPGVIILLHDGIGRRPQTVEAVRQLIPQIRARHYEFVRLDQLRA